MTGIRYDLICNSLRELIYLRLFFSLSVLSSVLVELNDFIAHRVFFIDLIAAQNYIKVLINAQKKSKI